MITSRPIAFSQLHAAPHGLRLSRSGTANVWVSPLVPSRTWNTCALVNRPMLFSDAVDVETLNQLSPRVPVTESIVFFSIMAVFFALRQRTEAAIITRDQRILTEKLLRTAMTARVEGEEGAAEEVTRLERELEDLTGKEEDLMNIPKTSFRLRLPPPPKDAEDIARERVMRSKQPASTKGGGVKLAPAKEEEERLPAWQEITLVAVTTAILAPFLFLAFADPIAPPSSFAAVGEGDTGWRPVRRLAACRWSLEVPEPSQRSARARSERQ